MPVHYKYIFFSKAGTSLPQIPVWAMSEMLYKIHKDIVISTPMPKKLAKRILFVHKKPETWDHLELNIDSPQALKT